MSKPRITRCPHLALDVALAFDAKPSASATPEATTAQAARLDVPRSWVQLARVGAYEGHGMGPFEFTAAVFEKMVANFARSKNRAVPVDFEHATEMAACAGSIPTGGAPATGWIVALENRRNEGLWGLVEWLEPGLTYVREKRYRFFSPAVVFDATDPATGAKVGPVLVSGALTNRPFLDGMAEVTAKRDDALPKEQATMKPEEMLKVLTLATGDNSLTLENFGEKITKLNSDKNTATSALAEVQKVEREREAKAAESDVDEAIKAGLIANTADARKGALDVRLSQPKVFASMFSARVEAAKAKPAAAPTTPSASPEAITQLTSRVATDAKGNPPDARPIFERRSDVVAAKAKELAAKHPDKYGKSMGGVVVPNADAVRAADRMIAEDGTARAS